MTHDIWTLSEVRIPEMVKTISPDYWRLGGCFFCTQQVNSHDNQCVFTNSCSVTTLNQNAT